jgi:hypothetical protein
MSPSIQNTAVKRVFDPTVMSRSRVVSSNLGKHKFFFLAPLEGSTEHQKYPKKEEHGLGRL